MYVCLVNGAGKKLIPGLIFSTGQTIPTSASSKLLLTLGNNSVKMKVNGVSVPVAPSSGSIGYRLVPAVTRRCRPRSSPSAHEPAIAARAPGSSSPAPRS